MESEMDYQLLNFEEELDAVLSCLDNEETAALVPAVLCEPEEPSSSKSPPLNRDGVHPVVDLEPSQPLPRPPPSPTHPTFVSSVSSSSIVPYSPSQHRVSFLSSTCSASPSSAPSSSSASVLATRSCPPDLVRVVPCVPSSLLSTQEPGELDFKIIIENNSKKWKYIEDERYLFIKKDTRVPVMFSTTEPLPQDATVRIMALYEELIEIESKGAVRNRLNDSDRRFIISPGPAIYEEYEGHDSVMLSVKDLPTSEIGPFGTISFTCTSSELDERGKRKAPKLTLIFHLLHNGREVGRDTLHLKVCSCVQRDSKRVLKTDTRQEGAPLGKKAKTVEPVKDEDREEFGGIHPKLFLVDHIQPDEDGLYTFTWRGRDKGLLNLFHCLKSAHELENSEEN